MNNKALSTLFAILVVVLILLLFGCAADPPRLVGEVRTVEVRVPVAVPCVVSVPNKPASVMPLPDADVARKAAGLSADARALSQHADELSAALRACAAGGKP